MSTTARKRKHSDDAEPSPQLQKQIESNEVQHAAVVESASKHVVEKGDEFNAMIFGLFKPRLMLTPQKPVECTRCGNVHFCSVHKQNCAPKVCATPTSLFFKQFIVSCRIFDRVNKTFCKGCKFTVCEKASELSDRGEEKKTPCVRCGVIYYAHGRNMTTGKSRKTNVLFHACNQKTGDGKFCGCLGFHMCASAVT